MIVAGFSVVVASPLRVFAFIPHSEIRIPHFS